MRAYTSAATQMIPCPGSRQLPVEVDPFTHTGACRCCGVRFARKDMAPVIEVSPTEVTLNDFALIPHHTPGSHHQEI